MLVRDKARRQGRRRDRGRVGEKTDRKIKKGEEGGGGRRER
jgi:hypothetical protein